MPTVTTAVRSLRPGDVILEPLPSPVGGAASFVVLDLAIADPGPVGLQLGRLGPIAPHLSRVATVAWSADAVLEVVRTRFSAVEELLEGHRVKAWHALADECDALRKVADNLRAALAAADTERHDEEKWTAFYDALDPSLLERVPA